MTPEYSGEKVDLEVARYGLRTFRPMPPGPVSDHMNWLIRVLGNPFGDPFDTVDEDSVLGPVYIAGQHWLDGTCEAECLRLMNYPNGYVVVWGASPMVSESPPEPHEAPEEKCHCGIYACHTLGHLRSQYPNNTKHVVAVVAAEGKTILGDKGFRTQYARVVAYWCSKELRAACERQFKDAAPYASVDEMVKAYGLDEPPKEEPRGKRETGVRMVTLSSSSWSVSAQKQQTQSKISLLKKLGII